LLLLLLLLLQFFAPYASIGGLEMPAAVYLLDFHKSGEDVRNYLSLIGPVLSSRDNIKVRCCARVLMHIHMVVALLLCSCVGKGSGMQGRIMWQDKAVWQDKLSFYTRCIWCWCC
jgi:hypothetical protein